MLCEHIVPRQESSLYKTKKHADIIGPRGPTEAEKQSAARAQAERADLALGHGVGPPNFPQKGRRNRAKFGKGSVMGVFYT